MKYTCYDMNAYNLHLINTDKFKTITVDVSFRRKIVKDEITIRNLLKDMMLNSSYNYPTERDLIRETEELYDLKLTSSNYRIGNDAILSFKIRFLNEKYTEPKMNEESLKFLLDIIFKPKLDNDVDKCKNKLKKSILSLSDNKIKYSLFKLLETTGDMPYAYNSYGYIDDLDKISVADLENYYDSIIKNDLIDVYVVGDIDEIKVKQLFKEYFKAVTFHKSEVSLIAGELLNIKKVKEYRERDDVNQTQLAILYSLHSLTDFERKYVMSVYSEMLGGSANSILFDDVREKNSYAYYVNAVAKAYDNILMVYAGIENNNDKKVLSLITKSLKNISKGKFDDTKFVSAKKTMISSIEASLDNPVGIINNYYAKVLVNSPDPDLRIKNINKVSKDDIIGISKKVILHTVYILEGQNEENND